MKQAYFRFYEELNDFLPLNRRKREFVHTFQGKVSIKDMIEGLGVPHTEVDLILVNGESVGFSCIVENNDRISVYPVFESFDISSLVKLRPGPLREPRFVLDVHLGKLAKHLRMLGFDSLYRNDYTDEQAARICAEERRILLTRDRGLLKRSIVDRGYWVRSGDPELQAKEVIKRFDLKNCAAPFTICLLCNGRLAAVDKRSIIHRIPEGVKKVRRRFASCSSCNKLFWEGSHYEVMKCLVDRLLKETPNY